MSMGSVKLFFEKVNEDEKMQEQIIYQVDKGQESYDEIVLSLASSYGYEFTKEDLKAYEDEILTSLAESGELSEEEMEAVSGGCILCDNPQMMRERIEEREQAWERQRLNRKERIRTQYFNNLVE